MAQTVVIDRKKNSRMPYLRGILTRSLQNSGLEFKQAYGLASKLRSEISHLEEISTKELRNLMAQMLASQCDSSVHRRYMAKANGDQTVMVRAVDGHAVPFSAGCTGSCWNLWAFRITRPGPSPRACTSSFRAHTWWRSITGSLAT